MDSRKNSFLLILLGLILGAIFLFFGSKNFSSKSYLACKKDSDCIIFSESCCDCNAGGKNIVINSKAAKKLRKSRGKKCSKVYCPQVVSSHWSCFAIPKCVNKRCKLIKKK